MSEAPTSPKGGSGGRPGRLGPARRSGLAGKLFAGALAASVPPLAIALSASIAVFMTLAGLVGEEVAREKARSAALLLESRIERLARFVDTAARENALVVNLELGIEQALRRYLSGLAAAEGLSALYVTRSDSDAPASAADGAAPPLAPSIALGAGSNGPEIVVMRPLVSASGSRLGTLVARTPLSPVLGRIAGVLRAGIALVEADLKVAVAVGSDGELIYPREGAAPPALPAAWGAPGDLSPAPGDLSPAPGDLSPAPGTFEGVACRFGAAPVGLGGLGLRLAVAYPETGLLRSRDGGLAALAAAGAAALLLAGLVAAYFVRTIVRPASALAHVAQRIAEGRYGLVSGIRLDDEIGDVARELDAMSVTLADQIRQRDVAEEALRQSELQFRSIFEAVGDAVIVHEIGSGAVVDANSATEALFGYAKEELAARPLELLGAEEGYGADRLKEALGEAAGDGVVRMEWRSRRKGGAAFWTELMLRRARIGGFDRVLATYRDIDARKTAEDARAKSLREKETLLREIHHRVKNNFQIINSLLSFKDPESDARSPFREPRDRIHAMALVHERLYLSEDFESIDFGAYVRDLASELYLAYVDDAERVALELRTEPLRIDIDRAIPCGLVLNELVTNALKYAFPPELGRGGSIAVELARDGDRAVLAVSDDGVGMAAVRQDESRGSMGLTLVRALADQLRGAFTVGTAAGTGGVRTELRFPLAGDRCASG